MKIDYAENGKWRKRMKEKEINKLTEKAIGLAIKVHKTLGAGFVENIYEKALMFEFEKDGLDFTNQDIIKVKYEGIELGKQRVDFIIEDEVILEIKSVSKIIEVFEYQLLSYLKTSNKQVGLILNFGTKTLEIKRIVNKL